MSAKDDVVHPEDVKHPPPPKKDRAAAWVADKCATVEFAVANLIFCVLWAFAGIEPFPYSGLTLALSIEAIMLTIFVLVQQRLENEMNKRESDADLKNDAIAAEEASATKKQLDRIERALRDSRAIEEKGTKKSGGRA